MARPGMGQNLILSHVSRGCTLSFCSVLQGFSLLALFVSTMAKLTPPCKYAQRTDSIYLTIELADVKVRW
jgi:hypothetical protein